MITDGVYLAAWTLESATDAAGWLVVEAEGGYNLELDGRKIDRRRHVLVSDIKAATVQDVFSSAHEPARLPAQAAVRPTAVWLLAPGSAAEL